MTLNEIALLHSGLAARAHALALAPKRRATRRRIGATRRGLGATRRRIGATRRGTRERSAARRFDDAISKWLGRGGRHFTPPGLTFLASVGSLSGFRSA